MSWLSRLFHRDPEVPAASEPGDTRDAAIHFSEDSEPDAAQAEPDPTSPGGDPGIHRVLIHEDRRGRFYGGHSIHSTWPADSEPPSGWSDTGFRGSREECSEEAGRLGILPIDIQKYFDLRRWRGATQHLLFNQGLVPWNAVLDVLNNLPGRLAEVLAGDGPTPTVPDLLYDAIKRDGWVELPLGGGGDAATPRAYAYKDRYMDWTSLVVAWQGRDFRPDRDVDRIYRLDELSGRRVPAVVLVTASPDLQALMQEQGADPALIPDVTDEDLLPVLDALYSNSARPVMLLAAKPAVWTDACAALSGDTGGTPAT